MDAREGARVVCVDIDEAAAQETANIIQSEGGAALAVHCDATQSSEIDEVVAACLGRFGRIDILLNNIGLAVMGSVVDISEADWDRAFAINLKTAILAMKHVIPAMAETGGGSVVNISSMTALRHVGVEYASYYASKSALSHLSRTTAVDFASRQVRVNTILPGMLKTPHVEKNIALTHAFGAEGEEDLDSMWRRRDARVPLGTMGDAWDVAWAAVFLASDEARYITGADLVVDGGMSLRVP